MWLIRLITALMIMSGVALAQGGYSGGVQPGFCQNGITQIGVNFKPQCQPTKNFLNSTYFNDVKPVSALRGMIVAALGSPARWTGLAIGGPNQVLHGGVEPQWKQMTSFDIAPSWLTGAGPIVLQNGANIQGANVNPTQVGATLYVDGFIAPCNDVGIQACLNALPTTGNTPGGTCVVSCPSSSAVIMQKTVNIGTATVPMTLFLNSGNYAFSNTSGNGFWVQGSGSRLIGNGALSTFITCNSGFSGDLVHVEPQAGASALNGIELAEYRTDQGNCPTVKSHNILSARDPTSIHNIYAANWISTTVQITTSGNPTAIIPQGVSVRDFYAQSASSGTLVASPVIITGNEIQWTASKVIMTPGATQGSVPLMTLEPTATTQGDGRRIHITDSSVAGDGGASSLGILITNPVGSSTGAAGNEIGPRVDFELCNLGWKITGSDASHKATNNHVMHNVYLPSTNLLGVLDFASSNSITEITNGNPGDITLTANSTNNSVLGFTSNATDISNSSNSNTICTMMSGVFSCPNEISSGQFRSTSNNASASGTVALGPNDVINWENSGLTGTCGLNKGANDALTYGCGTVRLSEVTAPSGFSGFSTLDPDSVEHMFKWANGTDAFEAGLRGRTAYLTSLYTNATTTMSNVTGLSFAVAANTNYKITCDLDYQVSINTIDIKIQWTGPASPTFLVYDLATEVTASTLSASVNPATATTTGAFSTVLTEAGTPTATTNFPLKTTMTLINGVNAGTVQLQAAATGAGTVSILPGSCEMSR